MLYCKQSKGRLAVSCFRSVSKASTCGPLHTLTSEFGWDLVLVCGIWPIAQWDVTAITWTWNGLHLYDALAKPVGSSSLTVHLVPKSSTKQTNTSLRDKLNLSRSQNKACSHAYNACSQLSRLHRMYHFQHTDIVFRHNRLFGNQFLSVDR